MDANSAVEGAVTETNLPDRNGWKVDRNGSALSRRR